MALKVCLSILLFVVVSHLTEVSSITAAEWDKEYAEYTNKRTACGSDKPCLDSVNNDYLTEAEEAVTFNLLARLTTCKDGEAQFEIQYQGKYIEGPAPCLE